MDHVPGIGEADAISPGKDFDDGSGIGIGFLARPVACTFSVWLFGRR